jgi:hypothetical protein
MENDIIKIELTKEQWDKLFKEFRFDPKETLLQLEYKSIHYEIVDPFHAAGLANPKYKYYLTVKRINE